MPRRDSFPTDADGRLINPDYIRDEGVRIMEAIAAGQGASNPTDATFSATNSAAQRPTESDWNYNMRTFGSGFAPKQTSAWDQSFGAPRSPRALREALSLEDLTSRAAERRAKLEQTQREAPLKEALAIAKLNHQRAATSVLGESSRLRSRLDADTMGQVSGFADYMHGAPDVGTDEYAKYVLSGLRKFPRIATTKWGKDTLDGIAQEHDTISRLRDQIPEGFDIKTMSIGKNQSSVSLQKKGGDVTKELKDGYDLTPGQITNPIKVEIGKNVDGSFAGDDKGDVVRIEKPDGSKVMMSIKEYERFGGKFSPETLEARGESAAPAAKPDLRALAQKALADPNATDAHRAAARKLLGQ